jgi:hypothetical protein
VLAPDDGSPGSRLGLKEAAIASKSGGSGTFPNGQAGLIAQSLMITRPPLDNQGGEVHSPTVSVRLLLTHRTAACRSDFLPSHGFLPWSP